LIEKSAFYGRYTNSLAVDVEGKEHLTFSEYLNKKSYQILSKIFSLYSDEEGKGNSSDTQSDESAM
jgi:hypothetical protein